MGETVFASACWRVLGDVGPTTAAGVTPATMGLAFICYCAAAARRSISVVSSALSRLPVYTCTLDR